MSALLQQILDRDDMEDNVHMVVFDADQAMDAAQFFIRAGLAGATAGGIALSVGDLKAVEAMLSLVKGRTAAALAASDELGLARLDGVA